MSTHISSYRNSESPMLGYVPLHGEYACECCISVSDEGFSFHAVESSSEDQRGSCTTLVDDDLISATVVTILTGTS